jgi:hypothetical protein
MITPGLLINGLSYWPDLAVCVLWGLYWPHSSILLVRNRSKHLTLSGLQGILAMKMTDVDDFEQFFDVNGRRRLICVVALQAPSDLFLPPVLPRKDLGAKIVQKMFKKFVDTPPQI